MGTYHSLVSQLVRLVTERNEVFHRPRRVCAGTDQGCGCCPICRAFVVVEFPPDEEFAACPSCGQAITEVEPLGG